MNILDESYANASDRLIFMVEEAERITQILRGVVVCAECSGDSYIPLSPNQRQVLSKEFREICKCIREEVELLASATDPEAATRVALANKSLPPHVRAAILAAEDFHDGTGE